MIRHAFTQCVRVLTINTFFSKSESSTGHRRCHSCSNVGAWVKISSSSRVTGHQGKQTHNNISPSSIPRQEFLFSLPKTEFRKLSSREQYHIRSCTLTELQVEVESLALLSTPAPPSPRESSSPSTCLRTFVIYSY